jgi:hypothetical protein
VARGFNRRIAGFNLRALFSDGRLELGGRGGIIRGNGEA